MIRINLMAADRPQKKPSRGGGGGGAPSGTPELSEDDLVAQISPPGRPME